MIVSGSDDNINNFNDKNADAKHKKIIKLK